MCISNLYFYIEAWILKFDIRKSLFDKIPTYAIKYFQYIPPSPTRGGVKKSSLEIQTANSFHVGKWKIFSNPRSRKRTTVRSGLKLKYLLSTNGHKSSNNGYGKPATNSQELSLISNPHRSINVCSRSAQIYTFRFNPSYRRSCDNLPKPLAKQLPSTTKIPTTMQPYSNQRELFKQTYLEYHPQFPILNRTSSQSITRCATPTYRIQPIYPESSPNSRNKRRERAQAFNNYTIPIASILIYPKRKPNPKKADVVVAQPRSGHLRIDHENNHISTFFLRSRSFPLFHFPRASGAESLIRNHHMTTTTFIYQTYSSFSESIGFRKSFRKSFGNHGSFWYKMSQMPSHNTSIPRRPFFPLFSWILSTLQPIPSLLFFA